MRSRPRPIMPLDKGDAIERLCWAMWQFQDVSHHPSQRIGAMIEALHLYCDEIKEHDPHLFNDAVREATRLHDIRMGTDPEYLNQKAEIMRQVRDFTGSPLVLPDLDTDASSPPTSH
jgi:hypothetical protein